MQLIIKSINQVEYKPGKTYWKVVDTTDTVYSIWEGEIAEGIRAGMTIDADIEIKGNYKHIIAFKPVAVAASMPPRPKPAPLPVMPSEAEETLKPTKGVTVRDEHIWRAVCLKASVELVAALIQAGLFKENLAVTLTPWVIFTAKELEKGWVE